MTLDPGRREEPQRDSTERYRIAAIIVNYRTPDLVVACLEAVIPEIERVDGTVVVVDDGSADGSAGRIRSEARARGWDQLLLVEEAENRGFSAANNAGIRAVQAQAYLLLNSDTMVRPGAVSTLLDTLEASPQVGLIGPRLEDADGTPQVNCFRYHNPISELINSAGTGPITRLLNRFDVPCPVASDGGEYDWVSFACVLIRSQVLKDVGPLDEGYFMYYEDTDYCRQARRRGWRAAYCPQAHVVHLRGGTSPVKKLTAARRRRPLYYYASRARYFRNSYGLGGLWVANCLWWVGRAVSLTREIVGNKQPHVCEREHRDIWTGAWGPLKDARA